MTRDVTARNGRLDALAANSGLWILQLAPPDAAPPARPDVTAYTEAGASPLDHFTIWCATLLPPPGAKPAAEPGAGDKVVGGAATLKDDPASKQTTADITVTNAPPASVLPWHVHTGTCEKSGGIYGPPQAYTPVHIGADGAGVVTVKLPFTLPSSGSFIVNVHRSVDDLATIVACGKPTRG